MGIKICQDIALLDGRTFGPSQRWARPSTTPFSIEIQYSTSFWELPLPFFWRCLAFRSINTLGTAQGILNSFSAAQVDTFWAINSISNYFTLIQQPIHPFFILYISFIWVTNAFSITCLLTHHYLPIPFRLTFVYLRGEIPMNSKQRYKKLSCFCPFFMDMGNYFFTRKDCSTCEWCYIFCVQKNRARKKPCILHYLNMNRLIVHKSVCPWRFGCRLRLRKGFQSI